jgi:hypothetical protein
MKGRRLIVTGFMAAAALVGASVLAQPSNDSRNGGHGNTGNGHCQLHSDNNRIQHVVYIQFDNVHFRRDLQNIPSDLEQMSNLRNFLVDNSTVLTDHHTPLISHTSVDILTTLTGVYGEKMGAPIGNKIAQKMIDMLEGVAFDNKSIDKRQAELLIFEAEGLVASVH